MRRFAPFLVGIGVGIVGVYSPLTAAITLAAPGVQTSRTIAVTFDDLPGIPVDGDCNRAAIVEMNRRLVTAVEAAQVPTLGVASEGVVCGSVRPQVLREVYALWLNAGFDLGNHTFSHPDLNTTSVADYRVDIRRGEEVLRPTLAARGQSLQYFRYPQLHAGDTPTKKEAVESFLAERGYVNAPVTIDNQEFVFAGAYRRALRDNHPEVARCVAAAYVPYMEEVVAFFEQWSVDVMGYEIPQVLMLHDNDLNAEYFPELVEMLRGRGYRFVSLDEALKDPAYSQPEEYVGPRGLSWIHRWALTRGMEVREEPRDPAWLGQLPVGGTSRWVCPVG